MKKKNSTVPGDIPWRVIREFSVELAGPLSNIYNTCTLNGVWPEVWKFEYITPVPKVSQPQTTDDLRKISGTKNLSKLYEALLSDTLVNDMSENADIAQFGNRKGLSITHYLVQMINRILTILDVNNEKEKNAVITQLIDWNKAFDRQDPKLGIQSLIKIGIRPTLIPVLASFFMKRRMAVKWHGLLSSPREMPGGGPAGCTLGLLLYDGNSNENANHVSPDMRFKFVDDLSILEKINLILAGLTNYNFRDHVASDIGVNQKFLSADNFETQASLNQIEKWTENNKMKLNTAKSNIMIFNFTDDFQFSTRLYLENKLLDTVQETKLLGTMITTDLKWQSNTDMLVKKAYKRMVILHKLCPFKVPVVDLVLIYKLYVRSILEQNCPVWHHSLTQEDQQNPERAQKVACKIILGEHYLDYT